MWSIELLFDQTNDVKHIYLTHEWIPNYDSINLPANCLFAITTQDLLIGLLQLHITVEKHAELDHLGNDKLIMVENVLFGKEVDLQIILIWVKFNGTIKVIVNT